jgi:hypothetical protein
METGPGQPVEPLRDVGFDDAGLGHAPPFPRTTLKGTQAFNSAKFHIDSLRTK